MMLALTARAAATLVEVRSRMGLPEHFGVRVFANPTPGERSPFHVEFVERPQEGDEVGEMAGIRFFVAPELAGPLAEHVLDAQEADERRRLVLRRRR